MKKPQSVMTQVWLLLAATGMIAAMFRNQLPGFNQAIIDAATSAVQLAIALAGITAVWLGLVKIIEHAGFMARLASWISPVMRRLFPELPPDHPASSAMTLSFSANLLGLGNAATPFGLKAMTLLDKLNPVKGVASDTMCLFLAITTSGLAILPTGVISIRMIAGATNPAAILIPTLLSTGTATIVAIGSCLVLKRISTQTEAPVEEAATPETAVPEPDVELFEDAPPTRWKQWVSGAFFLLCGAVLAYQVFGLGTEDRIQACLVGQGMNEVQLAAAVSCAGEASLSVECLESALGAAPSKSQVACLTGSIMNMITTSWMIPLLVMWFVFYGWVREIDVYTTMVQGMQEGLQIIMYIVPFLLSIFLAMGVFRASGAMDVLAELYAGLMGQLGLDPTWFPADVLPIALTRPLSGSGASALMIDLVNQSPDSFSAFLASVMAGSTDTTFYILAVYFGSVGVVRVRYAIIAGLLADIAGIGAAVVFSHLFYTAT